MLLLHLMYCIESQINGIQDGPTKRRVYHSVVGGVLFWYSIFISFCLPLIFANTKLFYISFNIRYAMSTKNNINLQQHPRVLCRAHVKFGMGRDLAETVQDGSFNWGNTLFLSDSESLFSTSTQLSRNSTIIFRVLTFNYFNLLLSISDN